MARPGLSSCARASHSTSTGGSSRPEMCGMPSFSSRNRRLPPEGRPTGGSLRLRDEKDGMPHISGRELPPVLVECDALAQLDSPGLAIRGHLPLFGQLRDVCARVAIDPDKEL